MHFRNFDSIDTLLKHANEKQLIIMRGLPGSGKSYKANQIVEEFGGKIFSTDSYPGLYSGEGKDIQFDPSKIVEAHQWNQSEAKKAMESGLSPIIIDNTNVQAWEAKEYVKFAKDFGYSVSFEYPESSIWTSLFNQNMTDDEKSELASVLAETNQHGVPEDRIKQMLDNWEHDITEESVLQSKYPWDE